MTHHTIRFADITTREAYKVMIGTIVPRPIAWVTTVSPDGIVNAAPYSFFNCLSADPPIVAFGLGLRPEGGVKDTAANIRDTGVFCVNMVDMANIRAMSETAAAFAPEVDELEMAGLSARPGAVLDCPRIAEAPVAFECSLFQSLAVSATRQIVLGRIECAHVREDIIDLETYYSDALALDAVGRMGGDGYSVTRDLFDLPTPAPDAVRAARQARQDATGPGEG